MTESFKRGFLEKVAAHWSSHLVPWTTKSEYDDLAAEQKRMDEDLDEYIAQMSKKDLKKEKDCIRTIFGDDYLDDPEAIRLSVMCSPRFTQFAMNKRMKEQFPDAPPLSLEDVISMEYSSRG